MNSEICSQTIGAGGCLVLAPGLLSGIESLPAKDPVLSGSLTRLLNFAEQINISETELPSVESLVASALLPQGCEPGAAHYTYFSDYPEATQLAGSVMRADPVYQQIDMNNATLGNPLELELTLEECTALQETLNHHFAEDRIRFECKDPHRWYCHLDSPLQVTTMPTSASIGRDVASVRPTGTDARRWRSKLAEIEMLLFEHPVNTDRQASNKLPVNTLWLWGEGSPVTDASVQNISIYSDNFYTRSVTQFLGLQCNELPDIASSIESSENSALIVIDKFTRPDFAGQNPNSNLQWFNQIVSDQIWSRLQSTGWPQVTLWLGDNRLFHVQAAVKKQFLRRIFQKSKPLSAYLPETGLSMDGMPMDTAPLPNNQRD